MVLWKNTHPNQPGNLIKMVDDDKKMVLDLREWHHDRGDKETAIIKKKPFEALSDIRFLKFDN